MSARHSPRATAALQRLSEVDPGLGLLALWCAHRDGEGERAAWTEGETVRYGPGFAALPPHEQVGLAAHHVLHVAFRHAARAGALRGRLGAGFDEEVFNIAADAIVNEALVAAGHALPRPAVLLGRLLAEAVGEAPPVAEALAHYDAERLYLRLASDGDRAGRREGGRPAAAERARDHARRLGFARDLAAGGSAAGDDGPAAEWRERVARALAANRAAGRGLGAAGGTLADLPRPRVPWETLLRGLVTRAVLHRPHRTPLRPSRRWIAAEAESRARGTPVPGYEAGSARDLALPRIAVCLDASGSVDDARLRRFAAEMAGIGQRTGAELHAIVFDAAVRAQRRLDGCAWAREVRTLALPREGGTDFRPALAAAAALAPSVIVVLTDLDGPLGEPPGRLPVIWAVPEPPRVPPSFGRVVSLAG